MELLHLARKIRGAIRPDLWLAPISIGVASRVALFTLALAFVAWRPGEHGASRPVPQAGLVSSFMQWDAGWYEEIARNGYSWKGPGEQSTFAFFPVLPMLARVVGRGLGGDIAGALFLIANLSFLVYLVYLYRICALEFDREAAERTVLLVALFPLSYFYSAGYTESLFLALVAATLYHARTGRWWIAVSLGAIATLTRLAGLAIVLPLAWEWHTRRRSRLEALGLLLPPAALGLFMLFCWRTTEDPLAFATVQAAWGRQVVGLGTALSFSYQAFGVIPYWHYYRPLLLLDLSSMIAHLGLLILSLRFMAPSYWLYCLPIYLLSTFSLTLGSGALPTGSIGRYLMTLFPHFMLLGYLCRSKWLYYLVLFLFAALGAPLALNFFAGTWTE
ncbi:MAG: mannosyltransferase family protein [Candidatus Polarisedimenticolia bacterium]